MAHFNRKSFLTTLLESAAAPEPSGGNDAPFRKYANKTLPAHLAKTNGGIEPYAGPWTSAEVIHLLRRTGFGIRPQDIDALLSLSPGDAVDLLLNNCPTTPEAPPVNNYNTASYTDPTGVAPGQTWVNADYGDGSVNGKRRASLKSWWTGLILNHNLSLYEKMVFFWHNHFSTEMDTIGDARIAYRHHKMLRAHATGNFRAMLGAVTRDPGMLKYLNGQQNTKSAPNENYARELQELFTVGKFNTPNYSESDVQEAARVLTGWRINAATLDSYFDDTKHDTGAKRFSTFYNNTVINGQSGAAGAAETDQLLDLICARPETARYLCAKLYRFFVYYLIDADVQSSIIEPLAQTLIANNYDIKPVLAQLFKSRHFFDANSRGCYISTPLDFTGNVFRTFNISFPSNFAVEKQYSVWNYLRGNAANLALDLGDPPNVAGYPAYYQSPEYHELWLNSNTYPKRLAFTDLMLGNGFSAGTGTAFRIDVLAFASGYSDAGDPNLLVDYCTRMLLGVDVSSASKAGLKGILLGGQTTDAYWTQAWQAYLSDPGTANTNAVKPKLTSLLQEITRLPEHQLI